MWNNQIATSIEFFFAVILAPILWIFGFRRRIFSRNLELMKWHRDSFLRFLLCFNASRDLAALFLGTIPKPRLDSRSRARLDELRNGPSLLLTAHFHNWEQLGSVLRNQGVPLLGAARPLQSPWAEKWLLKLRQRIGVLTVSESVPRAAIKHLQQGKCFGMLWDQHAKESECTGRFFGLPVQMNPLPGFLLSHHPCPVYFGVLLPGGNLRIIPLLSCFDGDWQEKLIRRYHRVLETLVHRQPEGWYGFFHARFKNIASYPGHRHATPVSPHPLPDSPRHGRRLRVFSETVRP